MPIRRVGAVSSIGELEPIYAEAPAGVRANMIFSADGAAAVGGSRRPASRLPPINSCWGTLRRFADVVLVGAGTARPVRLTEA